MQNHFRIARCLENRAFSFELAAELTRVSNVTVMSDGHIAFIASHRKRLRIQQNGIACGRVAGMADRRFAGEASEDLRRENFGHVTHALMAVNSAPIAGGDSSAFLSAML